jgi:16S rRNA (cytidine1402-2'-O)-methyltransferase
MEVIALPGATALIPAISASGLPCEKFFFQGFLPTKKGRATQLKFLSKLPVTIVIYESPHRIVKTIAELKEIFGKDRDCSIAKEISKLYEKYFNGSLEEVYQQLVQIPKMHGEFVLCIGPATNLKSALKQQFTDDDE